MSNLTNNDIKILESILPYVEEYYAAGFTLDASLTLAFERVQNICQEMIEQETQRSKDYKKQMKERFICEFLG